MHKHHHSDSVSMVMKGSTGYRLRMIAPEYMSIHLQHFEVDRTHQDSAAVRGAVLHYTVFGFKGVNISAAGSLTGYTKTMRV